MIERAADEDSAVRELWNGVDAVLSVELTQHRCALDEGRQSHCGQLELGRKILDQVLLPTEPLHLPSAEPKGSNRLSSSASPD